MTRQKSFKEQIRARMDKTGESYTAARRQLIEKAEGEATKRRTPRSISGIRTSAESVRKNTGRTWDEWFKLMDAWGAKDKKHPEMVRWLTDVHGVDGWWAQSITVKYEQERGIRAPGQRSDGTYGVSASKTVSVPVEKLFEAFSSKRLRSRWVGEHDLRVKTSNPGKTMTADWDDGSTRLSIGFIAKDPAKSQVALEHQKVRDAKAADELKTFWKERMNALKEMLES